MMGMTGKLVWSFCVELGFGDLGREKSTVLREMPH